MIQLVHKGAVDLDKPAGDYLPQLPSPSFHVKVRNLLDHTSGIPNHTDLPEFPMDKPIGLTRAQMLAYFASKPLQFPSSTRFDAHDVIDATKPAPSRQSSSGDPS